MSRGHTPKHQIQVLLTQAIRHKLRPASPTTTRAVSLKTGLLVAFDPLDITQYAGWTAHIHSPNQFD